MNECSSFSTECEMFSHLLQVRNPPVFVALVSALVLGLFCAPGCVSNPTPHPYGSDILTEDDTGRANTDPTATPPNANDEDDDGLAADVDNGAADAVAGQGPDVIDDVVDDAAVDGGDTGDGGDADDDNSTAGQAYPALPAAEPQVDDGSPY